jgi:hypothetical protein
MYIDPGTGSMLIQVLVAAIPVAAATLFAMRNKVRALFGKPPIEKKGKPVAEMGAAQTDVPADGFEKIDD